MKYCPITYLAIEPTECYSQKGLKLLSPQLKNLMPLELSAAEQRLEAIARAGKMSIQGVQSKLSAVLEVKAEKFNLVSSGGNYILKPQSEYYPELPENEAITMTLAAKFGIEVPVHGLVYAKDRSMTYFIKRFDRINLSHKLAVEDFSQLSQSRRDTKYNGSMEKVIKIIYQYCSFPRIESLKLYKLILFNFLVGNEDMHLKNFSLITKDNKIMLSPAYDLLNTTIAQPHTKEELALPLNGKKNNLTKSDLFKYLPEQLQLNAKTVEHVLAEIKAILPSWKNLISSSFLSVNMQNKYLVLLDERFNRIYSD